MTHKSINLKEKLGLFDEHWAPRVIAGLNDYQFKVAKIEGEFVWHKHDETDEAFLCLDGEMEILFRDGSVSLKSGELFVVPRGVEHKPVASSECSILLIEPSGVVNTGDGETKLRAENDVWI
ncbi:MAG TPA: cupin domain-containing protein [Xanthomonadales bacterium]|nr:cupin domain-containing protein [Xanthomonadales bacterium]